MFAIFLVLFITTCKKIAAAGINCEEIKNFGESKNCCYLNKSSVISAMNVKFTGPENSDVDAVLFNDNKFIQFLPVDVYKKFNNLEFYFAKNASITKVSVLNFKRLSNLKFLDLSFNQIEFIPNYCFEELTRLNELNLGNIKNI